VTLDDLEWSKCTLAEKKVLRSPPEKFERRQIHTISGIMYNDDSGFCQRLQLSSFSMAVCSETFKRISRI